MPANPCTVRLMTRSYVSALLTLPDRSLFLAGNYAWLGLSPGAAPRRRRGNGPGKSTYSPRRLVTLLLDAITSFSSYPLRLIFGVGVLIARSRCLPGVGAARLQDRAAREHLARLAVASWSRCGSSGG